LHLRVAPRKAPIVFPTSAKISSPSGDLVPGGAEPYLKAGWTQRVRHYAKEQVGMADKMIAPKDGAEPKKPKTSVPEFFAQVRAETNKIVWPTREAIFVFIFMAMLSVFFLGIDTVFGLIVNALIGLLK
jgi:preprotein translocase subunit SecE